MTSARHAAFTTFLLLSVLANAAQVARRAGEPRFVETCHVYPRGTPCVLTLRALGASAVEFDTAGVLARRVTGRGGAFEYRIDTARLRAGEYEVRARLIKGGKVSQTLAYPITVGRPHDAERMPVWWMGARGQDMDLVRERGFTGTLLPCIKDPIESSACEADMELLTGLLEKGAKTDFAFGLYLYPLKSKELAKHEGTCATRSNGRKASRVYPLAKPVLQHARDTMESCMRHLGAFPALRHALMCSEYQTPRASHPEALRSAQAEAGLDPDDNPLTFDLKRRRAWMEVDARECEDGIVSDDYPSYRFWKWWWERGHGTNAVNEEMAKILKTARPDILTWHEPYRLAPVRKSHRGLDMVVTWTYGHPEIRRLCYANYLRAAARPDAQRIGQDITLFVYGHFVMPLKRSTARGDSAGRDPYYTAGPDYAREATWLVFSQRPDVLMYYAAGSLHFANMTLDPAVTSPEPLDAIGEVSRALIEPYGPAVLDCRPLKSEVAVLASAAGVWFPEGKRPPGYPNDATVPYATLLMRNHVPFDVLLDDDVAEGRLKGYRLLVMPYSPTLTQTMATRIEEFTSRGGRAIANRPFRAHLPSVTVTDYDLSCWYRLSGRRTKDMITYDEYEATMERHARRLAEHLTGLSHPASSDAPRVMTNSLDGGDVHYHFFINDERTYGPRFGKHRLRRELGVPLTAELRVLLGNRPVLYDAIEHGRISYQTIDGCAVFKSELPAARGRLVAALPEPIQRVHIGLPKDAALGRPVDMELKVIGASGKPLVGSVPLRVDIVDPTGRATDWCRYTTTRRANQGVATFVWTPAINASAGQWTVTATDMVAGRQETVALVVKEG